jgi:hypothetical protein
MDTYWARIVFALPHSTPSWRRRVKMVLKSMKEDGSIKTCRWFMSVHVDLVPAAEAAEKMSK